MSRGLVVGIDVGGTFTDFAVLNKLKNEVYVDKRSTTRNLWGGVIDGLDHVLKEHGLAVKDVNEILHGTTIATNTVIERAGAKVGLICTKGFADILDIRTEKRYDLFDLHLKFPKSLVPRYLREPIDERIGPDGSVLVKANAEDINRAAKRLVEGEKVLSIAVCLMHSYVNPEHEEIVKKLVSDSYPDIHVSVSSDIYPRIREYHRTSMTVVNAYIQPRVDEYLSTIQNELAKRGFKGHLYIMTNSGGAVETDFARQYPVNILSSGEVAGVLVCDYIGKKKGIRNVIVCDIGGTTAKGSIIQGALFKVSEMEIARSYRQKRGSGIPIMVPHVGLIEIGSGGGSIARIDERGVIQAGPESAGGSPGPACYGLGGKRPTVTDADLILGYLNPDYFLGGEMSISIDLARSAIAEHLARPLGITVEEAAWGIHETLNEDVIKALKVHSAERGIDYRQLTMITLGGAGPVHACRIARKMNLSGVVLPFDSGVLTAKGLLVAPISFDFSRTFRAPLDTLDPQSYVSVFSELVERGLDMLAKAQVPGKVARILRSLDMKYAGQGYEIEVGLAKGLPQKKEIERLAALFKQKYQSIYTATGLSARIEIVNFKATVSAPQRSAPLSSLSSLTTGRAGKGRRRVYFDEKGYINCQIYDRYRLRPKAKIRGPAIIESRDSTCVLEPNVSASVDDMLNLVVDLQ